MTDFIVIDLGFLLKNRNYKNSIRSVYRYLNIPIPSEKEAVPIYLEDKTYEYLLYFMWSSKHVSKIWVNPSNGFVIAYEDHNGYSFSEHFNNHLVNIESVEISDQILDEFNDFPEMDTDSILDKISKYGINSLTREELLYLNNL
jgi:hypothetical protein